MGGYIGGNGGVTQVDGYNKTEVDSKVSDKVEDSQVLTDVPASAVFTDTTYSIQDGELSQNNFTDADHSKLDGIETGATADQTKADIEGLGIDVPATNLTGTIPAARLSTATTQAESDDSTKIATTAYVVDKITTLIGGAPSTLNDLNELAAAINDDANYNSTLTTALGTKLPKAGGAITGNVTFGDNNKAIFGAGSDLQIYHDGSNSYITDTGAGDLIIDSNGNAIRLKGTNGENMIVADTDSSAKLFYDGTESLATTATGINVTGTVTSDGLVIGSSSISAGTGLFQQIQTAGNNMYVGIGSNNSAYVQANGEFRIATGGYADKVTVTTSGQVGIGTSTPSEKLHVSSSGGQFLVNSNGHITSKQSLDVATAGGRFTGESSRGTLGNIMIEQTTTGVDGGYIRLSTCASGSTNPVERMRIDSSGNVGIGQTPSATSSYMVALQVGEQANLYGHVDGTGAGSATYLSNNITHNAGEKYINSDSGSLYAQSSGTHKWYNYPSGTAGATATPSESMRIDSSGRVGIGTNSPSAKLTMTDEDAGQAMLQVRNFSTGATGSFGNDHSVELRSATSTTTHGVLIHHNENNIGRRTLDVSDSNGIFASFVQGKVGIGTTSPSAGLELNLASGDGLLINSADIATIKMKNINNGVQNWGFATTNLAASDFGIYRSNSNGGDPITAGAAKLYFNASGNATFSGTVAATSYTGDGSNLTGVGGSTTAGAVGTYMFAVVVSSFSNQSAGDTRAGSTLREANAWNASNGTTVGYNNNSLSGTWRLMGDILNYNGSSTETTAKYLSQTLWLRIS